MSLAVKHVASTIEMSEKEMLQLLLMRLMHQDETLLSMKDTLEKQKNMMEQMRIELDGQLLDVKGIGKLIGAGEHKVRALVKSGRIGAVNLRPIQVKRSEVQRYLAHIDDSRVRLPILGLAGRP